MAHGPKMRSRKYERSRSAVSRQRSERAVLVALRCEEPCAAENGFGNNFGDQARHADAGNACLVDWLEICRLRHDVCMSWC